MCTTHRARGAAAGALAVDAGGDKNRRTSPLLARSADRTVLDRAPSFQPRTAGRRSMRSLLAAPEAGEGDRGEAQASGDRTLALELRLRRCGSGRRPRLGLGMCPQVPRDSASSASCATMSTMSTSCCQSRAIASRRSRDGWSGSRAPSRRCSRCCGRFEAGKPSATGVSRAASSASRQQAGPTALLVTRSAVSGLRHQRQRQQQR